MNLKYEVGQMVSIEVPKTITEIISAEIKSITIGASGAKYLTSKGAFTEEQLDGFAQPAQEKPAQPKEPIKLYCVKEYKPGMWLTKGKVYEVVDGKVTTDSGYVTRYNNDGLGGVGFQEYFVPLVSRPAKIGEWVYITRDGIWHSKSYRAGEIYPVDKLNGIDSTCCYFHYLKQDELFFGQKSYLVLDGYKPEQEYLNMRVVCVDAGFIATLTVGKVYEVKGGFFHNDAGRENPLFTGALASLEDMNARHSAKFIEFKGE